MSNINRAPLKPDQKLNIMKEHVIPRLLYTLQNPEINAKKLKDTSKLIKLWVKRYLHLCVTTPDAALFGRLKDGRLGLLDLTKAIPEMLLRRINKIATEGDPVMHSLMEHELILKLRESLSRMTSGAPAALHWQQKITQRPTTKGLEQANKHSASRGWIDRKPKGWCGRLQRESCRIPRTFENA